MLIAWPHDPIHRRNIKHDSIHESCNLNCRFKLLPSPSKVCENFTHFVNEEANCTCLSQHAKCCIVWSWWCSLHTIWIKEVASIGWSESLMTRSKITRALKRSIALDFCMFCKLRALNQSKFVPKPEFNGGHLLSMWSGVDVMLVIDDGVCCLVSFVTWMPMF